MCRLHCARLIRKVQDGNDVDKIKQCAESGGKNKLSQKLMYYRRPDSFKDHDLNVLRNM